MGRVASLGLLALAGCSHGGRPPNDPASAHERLVSAAKQHDAAAIASLLRAPLSYGGLWFADRGCAAKFPTAATLGADQLAAFAKCIAALKLESSPRRSALADGVILTYDPGIEIELRFGVDDTGAWLSSIGYLGRREPGDPEPTISPSALELRREAGMREPELDADAHTKLDEDINLSGNTYAYAWLRVCVDPNGAVTTSPRDGSSQAAEDVFAAAVRDWRFRPFDPGGSAFTVCTLKRFTYGTSPTDEVLPLPQLPGPLRTVSPDALGKRIAGVPEVAPTEPIKLELAKHHNPALFGVFRFCLAETGAVDNVTTVLSSGNTDYDALIKTAIHAWRYKPYVSNGKPAAICSEVVYSYRQS